MVSRSLGRGRGEREAGVRMRVVRRSPSGRSSVSRQKATRTSAQRTSKRAKTTGAALRGALGGSYGLSGVSSVPFAPTRRDGRTADDAHKARCGAQRAMGRRRRGASVLSKLTMSIAGGGATETEKNATPFGATSASTPLFGSPRPDGDGSDDAATCTTAPDRRSRPSSSPRRRKSSPRRRPRNANASPSTTTPGFAPRRAFSSIRRRTHALLSLDLSRDRSPSHRTRMASDAGRAHAQISGRRRRRAARHPRIDARRISASSITKAPRWFASTYRDLTRSTRRDATNTAVKPNKCTDTAPHDPIESTLARLLVPPLLAPSRRLGPRPHKHPRAAHHARHRAPRTRAENVPRHPLAPRPRPTARASAARRRVDDDVDRARPIQRSLAALLAAACVAAVPFDADAALVNPNTRLPRSARAALRRAVPAINEETARRKAPRGGGDSCASLSASPGRDERGRGGDSTCIEEKRADVFAPVREDDRGGRRRRTRAERRVGRHCRARGRETSTRSTRRSRARWTD